MGHKEYDKYERRGDTHWQEYHHPKLGWGYKELVDTAINFFKNEQPGTIIDVGCGDGLPLSFLDILGYKCFGVDSNKKGVDIALDKGVSAEYFIETVEKFAERGLEFDFLLSINTIEHLDDPGALAKIMKGVRKFGVIITDDDTDSDPELRDEYHEWMFNDELFKHFFKTEEFEIERTVVPGLKFLIYKIKNK